MNFKFLLLFLIVLLSPVASASMIINEIMYAPNGNWGGQYNEWIELFNNDTSSEMDITNWTINGKIIPQASIAPQGYLILAKNSTKLKETYNLSSVQVPFTLSNNGETINLTTLGGVIADTFDYTEYAAANLAKNNNRTLERNASGWFESAAIGGTPGVANSILSSGIALIQNQSNETQNIINGTETIDASQIQVSQKAPGIEIIGAPEVLKFGDYSPIHARFRSGNRNFQKLRFVAYIYKPSWIARDLLADESALRNSPYDSGAAAEVLGIAANETIRMVLPLFIKCNTEGYANATYTARVRTYEPAGNEWKPLVESDRDIFISGESGSCKKELIYSGKNPEKNCTEKTRIVLEAPLEINVTYPEAVFIGENFTTTVFLENNENISQDLEVYSYIYEHSAVMSSGFDGSKWGNARTANAKKVTLASGNSTAIELVSRAKENTTAEKYTYKVRIDDLSDDKKSEERIYLIEVKARETIRNNETVSNATETDGKITGAVLLKNTDTAKLSFWDRIIYKIKSWLK